jgi:hypothetical protein
MENPQERTQLFLDDEDHRIMLQRVLKKIREGLTTELDPCIGDQGCHMRSLPLCMVANKVLDGDMLTEEEERFLVALEIVWANTIRTVTRNGVFLREKTGSDILPPEIKGKYTGKRKSHIMYAYRKLAANFAIKFFNQSAQAFQLLHPDLLQSLNHSLERDQRLLDRELEMIICIPYLTSGKIILQQINEWGHPFIIVVKRYTVVDGKFWLQEVRPLFYTLEDGGEYRAVQGPVDSNVPCVCFEFYSFYDPSFPHESPLYHPDFEVYLEELRKHDMPDLIASNWVKHEQFADVINHQIPPSYLTNTNALQQEYNRLQALDQQNKLPPIIQVKVADVYVPGNAPVDRDVYRLLDQRPWFLLSHIYCSNFNHRRTYCEHLNQQVDELLPPIIRILKDHNAYVNALHIDPN